MKKKPAIVSTKHTSSLKKQNYYILTIGSVTIARHIAVYTNVKLRL